MTGQPDDNSRDEMNEIEPDEIEQDLRIEFTDVSDAFVSVAAGDPALDSDEGRRAWAGQVLTDRFGDQGGQAHAEYFVELLAFLARDDYPDRTWLTKWVHLPQPGVEPLTVQLTQVELPADVVGDGEASERALRDLCGEGITSEGGESLAVATVETPAGTAYSGFTTYRTPDAPAESLVLGRLVYAWLLPGGADALVLWSRGEPVRVLAASADIDELAASLSVTIE